MAAKHKRQFGNGTPLKRRVRRDVSKIENRTVTGRKWWRPDVVSVLMFMAFTIVCAGGLEEQRFALEPHDQKVMVGSNVTLPCIVVNQKGSVQWTKNGFGLGTDRNLTAYPRYSMTGSGQEGDFSLHITDVQLEDDGEYQCQVNIGPNNEAPIRSRLIRLTIMVVPDPPVIVQGGFIDAIEDQPVDIECISSGGKPATEMVWLDGNQQVIKKDIKNIVEVLPDGYLTKTRSVLKIVPTKEHHNKTITCQAQNIAERSYRNAMVHLEVKYAPKLSMSVKSEEEFLMEGQEGRIRCDAEANPSPQRYHWYINGNPVIGDYNEEMIIFNVTRKLNNAEVICEVSNSIGKSEKSLSLEVSYPPSFRTRPENIEANLESSVTLSCDVDGQPQPEIRWLFHEPGRIGVKGKAPNLNVHVTNETAGRYICKASVKGYPEIESEATIFIKGPPQIVSNRTQFGSEGDTVRVQCAALSVPKPDDIRWYFEGREISVIQDPDYATLEEYLPDGTIKSSLVIRASQSKHYGVYNCSVTNELGNANVVIYLKPLQTLPLFIILIGVTSGIIIFSAFIVSLIICHRRRRQNSKQKNEKPDVTVTSADLYKESDRSSNISDLKIQLPQSDGTYELEYTTSSDRSDTKIPVGLPLAGPVRLPKIRDDHLMNFRYSNDYSDPTYSDPYYKSGYVYDYPQGYAPPSHLRVQSPTHHLDVPAATRSLQGSLTRSIDTTSTFPLSTGNVSQNSSLQRTKDDDETDEINRLGLPIGGDSPPPPAPVYAQPNSKNAVDIRYAATYGNPYLRNSSLGYNQVHSVKPGNPAPPPYSARNSVVLPSVRRLRDPRPAPALPPSRSRCSRGRADEEFNMDRATSPAHSHHTPYHHNQATP